MKNKIILLVSLLFILASCISQKEIYNTYTKGGPVIFKNQIK